VGNSSQQALAAELCCNIVWQRKRRARLKKHMPSKLQVVKLLELPCSGSVSPSPCCCCAALSQDSPATARPALKTLLPPRPSDSNSGLLLSPIGL